MLYYFEIFHLLRHAFNRQRGYLACYNNIYVIWRAILHRVTKEGGKLFRISKIGAN